MPGKHKGFQFKQFYIEHSQCAMKVGTDSIMLGSWIEPAQAQTILDIGTGSGLLALMLAQKSLSTTKILGIDIDQDAIKQATDNGLDSPWVDKLVFVQSALQKLHTQTEYCQSFDLIVTNPPYFAQNTTANQQNAHKADVKRIVARQTASLEHAELLKYVSMHLSQEGKFCCVLPADSAETFINNAAQLGLHLEHQLLIQTKPDGKFNRVLLKFSRYDKGTKINQLTIYNKDKHYSEDYISLCKAFYLHF